MAVAPFSTSLFPPFPSIFKTSLFTIKSFKTRSTSSLILSQFSLETHHKKPPTADPPEFDGTGAAAPTRGDRFLEHHHSVEAVNFVLKENKKNRKKKKDKALKVSLAVASCYGCGAPLQTLESDAPGYVEPETYELVLSGPGSGGLDLILGLSRDWSMLLNYICLMSVYGQKKKHHQLRRVICGRCRLLSHGHMITAVGGNGGYSGGKQFITAEELRVKLSHLRYEKALIVKLVDIVDFNGSFLARVRDLAGANPIILVVTKVVDLLPKGTDLNCIGDWVVEATVKKKLSVLSVHLTSSKSLVGVAGVVADIQKEKKGRDVYILKIFDTPGVHLHHRLAAVVHSEDLPALAPQSRLRGHNFQVDQLATDNEMGSKDLSSGLNGFSIFWGGLARVDLLKHFIYVNRPACDVAISGLGWITFERKKSLQNNHSDLESSVDELELAVHVPKPVEIFVRPPMPVGKAGSEWYQYRDLTEEEEETRPKWFF
ncbi:NO-associated protein 1, chloroplastic/mitochondrial, partial [Cucurbita argyrosperma subsp. argyrosperma]